MIFYYDIPSKVIQMPTLDHMKNKLLLLPAGRDAPNSGFYQINGFLLKIGRIVISHGPPMSLGAGHLPFLGSWALK